MYIPTAFLFGLSLHQLYAFATPLDQTWNTAEDSSPNLLKRAPGIGPVEYPYGAAHLNEFKYQGWDPQSDSQKADAKKVHDAFADWANMVYYALKEIDAVSDTFKRWFDEGDADNVKKVFLKMFDPSGAGQPTKLMPELTCLQADTGSKCTGSTNAYSIYNKGLFHFCPKGLALPRADSVKCDALDKFPSAKMKSVAFTMAHEFVHQQLIGDAALGKHIGDIRNANGAYACTQLSGPDKLLNAQNYAFLAAEAYYKKKNCKFENPPKDTDGPDDGNGDDLKGREGDYSSGTCKIILHQWQKNLANASPAEDNNPNYQVSVAVKDDKDTLLNPVDGNPDNTDFFVTYDGETVGLDLPLTGGGLYITLGAGDDDPVTFEYGYVNNPVTWDSGHTDSHKSVWTNWQDGSRKIYTEFDC